MFHELAKGIWISEMEVSSSIEAEVREAIASASAHVQKAGRGPGSLEPEETAGLDYHVVTGEKVVATCPTLWARYSSNELLRGVGDATGEVIRKDPHVASSININYLAGKDHRYELHTDSQPYTLIWYMNTPAGGHLECWLQDPSDADHPDVVLRIPARKGRMVLFDGSRVPHAVAPLLGDTTRISVPMVFSPIGVQRREAQTDSYLYDKPLERQVSEAHRAHVEANRAAQEALSEAGAAEEDAKQYTPHSITDKPEYWRITDGT